MKSLKMRRNPVLSAVTVWRIRLLSRWSKWITVPCGCTERDSELLLHNTHCPRASVCLRYACLRLAEPMLKLDEQVREKERESFHKFYCHESILKTLHLFC